MAATHLFLLLLIMRNSIFIHHKKSPDNKHFMPYALFPLPTLLINKEIIKLEECLH